VTVQLPTKFKFNFQYLWHTEISNKKIYISLHIFLNS